MGKAFVVFERRINEYEQDPEKEAYQMALVQGFEVIHELSWKVLKDYLENEGYDNVQNSRQAIKQAFQAEIITDGEVWMDSIGGWILLKIESVQAIHMIWRHLQKYWSLFIIDFVRR